MAKKSVEKTRKNRTTPAEPKTTGRFQADQKQTANESIEMAQRNRPTPASDEQPGRGQAIRDWFSSSFGRKEKDSIP